MRDIVVNMKTVSVPVGATALEIINLAIAAGIKPSKWGTGVFELREYKGSSAKLLKDSDVPKRNEFGLREVDPKEEPGFKTLVGWDKEVVSTYPDYVQKALKGEGARFFSGSWDEGTIGPAGYMTPHQISGAAYVPLVKVYTASGNSWYEIPSFTWVNENGEPNPYQDNGRFLLPIDKALILIEAFRKYRAYRRDRFGGGLPPEMQGLSVEALQPIKDYIAYMKSKERAGWSTTAYGPDYVKPKPVVVTRENVARTWNADAGRVETLDEAYARVTKKVEQKVIADPEPPLPVPSQLSEKVFTPFKRGWNRFYKANGELPEEVKNIAVRWNGLLRLRFKADHVDDFGEFIVVEINGLDFTMKRHRNGKYYEAKLDAPEMKQIVEYVE